jgi:hypothetical protein
MFAQRISLVGRRALYKSFILKIISTHYGKEEKSGEEESCEEKELEAPQITS